MVGVVIDEPFELAPVPDDGAAEQCAAQGPDPSFSEDIGNRGADRRLEDFEAFRVS
jgi:hypothetical protein